MHSSLDAIIVGAGPNGLSAAIELARAGKHVRVYEAANTVGGGARSANLTVPGFVHDICSAVYPLTVTSPFLRTLPLQQYGLEFIEPPAALAHPFDDGTVILLKRSLESTSDQLGMDQSSYRKLLLPLIDNWESIASEILGPLRFPRHPVALARFGFHAVRSAERIAKSFFREPRTRAFWAGMAAHSALPLDKLGTAAFGLVLATLGHVAGWPIARGGAQAISTALSSYLCDLGGEIITNTRIRSIRELPAARCVLFDVTPRQLLEILNERLPSRFAKKLCRYRYGPGAFKMDFALAGPVPWLATECRKAATLHLTGSFEETMESERAAWSGRTTKRPFVIACQPSLFDPSRAPKDKHVLWAYCHVPNGSDVNMSTAIEDQIERFAPGFRNLVLQRSSMSPAELENHNANLVGGDVNGGAQTLLQMFTRPTISTYSTPIKDIYICSSSTPPGGGVHGMCGYHAAQVALRKSF